MKKINGLLLSGIIVLSLLMFALPDTIRTVAAPIWPVTYIGEDWTTKGDWVGKYGTYAYILPKASVPLREIPWEPEQDYVGGKHLVYPNEPVEYSLSGAVEMAALLTPDGTHRRAACYFWSPSFAVTLDIPAGDYQLSLYFVDYDSYARGELAVVSSSLGSAPTTTVVGFHEGVHEIYELHPTSPDTVTITLTWTSGANAVISGVFLDSTGPGTGISYVGEDSTTKGNWVGAYGSLWYLLCAMDVPITEMNYSWNPTYDIVGGVLTVSYSTTGMLWAWTDYLDLYVEYPVLVWGWLPRPTTDQRACWYPDETDRVYEGYPPPVTHRQAECWDSDIYPYFTVDLSVPQGTYYLSLYALDYASYLRVQTIEIFDSGGTLLASVLVSDFHIGVYERFFVEGPIDLFIRVEKIAGANSVLSGIFLDNPIECDKKVLYPDSAPMTGLELFTRYDWYIRITLENLWTEDGLEDVRLHDRFGAEFGVEVVYYSHGTDPELTPHGKSAKIFLEWNIGALAAGETATLILHVWTDCNPSKGGMVHQQFASPGEYYMNSGATVQANDPSTGRQFSTTSAQIKVSAVEG